jgi:hypothetical protein
MTTTYDSTTSLDLGNGDLSTGNGQLGKAVFLAAAATINTNTLGAYYDTYVVQGNLAVQFILPTAIRGYKINILNAQTLATSVITLRDDTNTITVYSLPATKGITLQLTGIAPQTWFVYYQRPTLNDAYKNGADGIINRDATRRAVKVSNFATPSVANTLFAVTYDTAGVEDTSLESGAGYVELLCANGTGVVPKSGNNIAISATIPASSLRSVVKGSAPTGTIVDSLIFGPVTVNNDANSSIYLSPNSTLTLPTPTASSDVIIAPNTTINQTTPTPSVLARRSVCVGAGGSFLFDDAILSTFIGANNTINATLSQFPRTIIIGSVNTFTHPIKANQTNCVTIGSNNNLSTQNASTNAVMVGSGNNSTGLAGAFTIIGSQNTFTPSAASSAISPAMLSGQTTFLDSLGNNSPTGFCFQSTLDSTGIRNAIGVSTSNIKNRNPAANMCIFGKTQNIDVSPVSLISIGSDITMNSVGLTTTGCGVVLGSEISVVSVPDTGSLIALGSSLTISAPNLIVEKAILNATPSTITGSSMASKKVTCSTGHRLSSAAVADTAATLDLDNDATPASALGFDSAFEQKTLFRPITIASAASGSVTLSSALPTNSVMALEYWFTILDAVAGTSNVHHGVTRVSRIGGVATVDVPVSDNFVGIAAPPTVTLTIVANAPTFSVANTAVGANAIRVSGRVCFSTLI